MTRPTSPTLSRRWLARELRRWRTEADLQQADVAKALGCRVPKVSLMESGTRPVQEEDLKKLLDFFDVAASDHQLYFDELANAHEKGWWEHYDDTLVPDWLAKFIGFEDGANLIRIYQPAVMHGLLQSRGYTTALIRSGPVGVSEEKIRRQVDLRQVRQKRFADGTQDLAVVLDEAVLHRMVGDVEVMRAQLEAVVNLVQTNSRVSLQVLPFVHGGAWEAGYGAFTILTSPLRGDPGVVYIENRAGATFLEGLNQIDVYSQLFAHLSQLALPGEESLEMLRDHVKKLA